MASKPGLVFRAAAAAGVCALLAVAALPAAAAPPAAAGPAAAPAGAPTGAGLTSLVGGWLHRLFGAPPDEPPVVEDGPVHDKRTGPAGPLIDPNGNRPSDPRPRNDGVPHRG